MFSTDYNINSVDEFNDLNLSAGDNVIWQDGSYSSDERIRFLGSGTANNPITLRAETPGGVIFTGGLQMDIAGSYLIVDGFYWNGGYGASNFIQFRNGENYAQNCTIQNCAINGLEAEPGDAAESLADGAIIKHRWIVLYGNYNSVLNCSFMNKNTAGALVLAEYEYNAEDNRCTEVGHTISNNYFYNYEKQDASLSNAGDSETIRIGTSEYQNVNSQALVSGNYFVQADGENEIITNKSMNNTYLNNTFRRSRGSLVMRHGSDATVTGNYFLGENVEGTGAIRITDSNHQITNNYIQDCVSSVEQTAWNNGLTFVGGNTNSVQSCTTTSVSNDYQDVENINFSNNTFINTHSPFYFNATRDGADDVFGDVSNNLIYFQSNNDNTTDVINGSYSDIGSNLAFSGNVYDGATSLGESASGFSQESISVTRNGEIFTHNQSGKGASISDAPITDSMVGNGVGACFLSAEGNSQTDCDGTTTTTDSLTVGSLSQFDADGASQTVTVSSNVDWTVSENTSWISINRTSGSDNGSVTVTTTENTSTSTRSATITIAGSGISRTVNVSQAGAEDTPTESLTVSSINDFDADGDSQTVTVTSNIDWTVSENSSWIAINNNSGSDNGSFSITTSENTSTNERSATVTITGGDISRSITVSQEGAEDEIPTATFTPDPSKTYYIDSPVHNLRLAATGESEDAYTTTTNTTGNDVEWAFVDKGNGYWHLQRAAGGSKPRLRTDNSANADMQATTSSGTFTYYEIAEGASDNTYFFTLPDRSNEFKRLQINNSGDVKMVADTSDGTWESFSITEVNEVVNPNDNLALDGAASQSTTAHGGRATRAIDGDINGSFSGASVTHTSAVTDSWWQVELSSQTNIGDIIIYNRTDSCCIERLSDFTVTVYDSNNNEVFSQTITEAPTPSITINANGALGNRVRVTNNLNNSPLSLAEVEVYSSGGTNTPTTSCTAGTNLSLNGTIVDFSEEQNSTNTVNNIIDDSTGNRWSAETFPQYATVDLGDEYAINEINLATFNNRDYQFTVEGSTNSATSGFSTIVDATNNTDQGTINRTFSAQTVRYVRLTITGANSYTGEWSSISKFEIICSGNTASKDVSEIINSIDVTTFPNPFTSTITVANTNENAAILRLVNLQGITITETPILNNETELNNLEYLANGMYLIQVLNTSNQVISIQKVIK